MTTAQSNELDPTLNMMVPLSVDQYHKMIDAGILQEGAPIELLDGFLFRKDRSAAGADPMTVGAAHINTVSKISWLLRSAQDVWHCRIQQPVTLLPDSEPEPDIALLRGTPFDYGEQGATANDVACFIEVADSSLRHDRVTKQRIYADASIPQYIIVNLIDHAIEVYSEPLAGSGRYAKMEAFRRGQTIRLLLPTGEYLDLPADQILP